jgi:hypothetical protein
MVTIIYSYYGQKERIPGILAEKHPQTRVIIVDDHSKEPLGKLNGIDVYRIDEDIAWNCGGATNLGFQESEGWVVYADIDHLITKKNVEEILQIKKERGTIYLLGRKFEREALACYLIHKDDFEKVGGYDEDFSGHYGYMDLMFILHCRADLKVVERRDIKVEYFDDAVDLDRDESFNENLFHEKKFEEKNTGRRIRFKWHCV